MNATTGTLTTEDLLRASRDDRWLGFGYLGERANQLNESDPGRPASPVTVAAVDQAIIDHANRAGWTYEDLFAWANSKNGRWFADATFGAGRSARLADLIASATAQGLLAVPVQEA